MKVIIKQECLDEKCQRFLDDYESSGRQFEVIEKNVLDSNEEFCYKVKAKIGFKRLGYWLPRAESCREVIDYDFELSEDLFIL